MPVLLHVYVESATIIKLGNKKNSSLCGTEGVQYLANQVQKEIQAQQEHFPWKKSTP